MIELPRDFLDRMKEELKGDFDAFIASYDRAPARAIRVNTLKISIDDFLKISPFPLRPVPWEESGFFTDSEGPGRTPLHAAGAYYVQEPSAMSVVPKAVKAANEIKGKRVLDLCSAPGGKGTQLAAAMGGEGILVLNEPILSRRDILAENVERLGVGNAIISCARPEQLAKSFENYFDLILVDAPCSGEGMFKKEPNAIPEWSRENVIKCAQRQSDILNEADKMLCGGGILAYSTCTFSREEDEEQIQNFLKSHVGYTLVEEKKLYPHEMCGEGHFYAILKKIEGDRADDFPPLNPSKSPKDKAALDVYRKWEGETLKLRLDNIAVRGENIYQIPQNAPKFEADYPVQTLLPIGRTDGKNFFPHHSLAMRLNCGGAETFALDYDGAVSFLKGLTLPCPADMKGWYLAAYSNLPLGWVKAVNGTAKNHYPKGLRI